MTTPVLAKLPGSYDLNPTVHVWTDRTDVRIRCLAIHLTAHTLTVRADTGQPIAWHTAGTIGIEDSVLAHGWAITGDRM